MAFSINGGCFSASFHLPSIDNEKRLRHGKMVKEIGYILNNTDRKDPLEGLVMIDTLQRLSIDYHFREEIESFLKTQYMNFRSPNHPPLDVFGVALCFRLLRQEGYNVSQEVFNSFKNEEGNFHFIQENDVKGLMEFEDILDEAGDFSARLLKRHESEIVANTLEHPYHKSLARVMVKNFLNNIDIRNENIKVFSEFAKIDYEIVRSIHQKEILQITNWWKDLGLAKELKFARDQPLKWHMWSISVLADPNLSEHRVDLTRPISLVYIIDDIFDLHGTLDDLSVFTEAVNEWDFTGANQLPESMKISLKALFDTTESISTNIFEKHGWNPIESLQKSWKKLCNAFLVEAKWFAQGEFPKSEEYLRNGIVSSGVHVILVHMFFLLGQGINKETVDFVDGFPPIITLTATILRLWDDLGTAKDENQDGNDGSYLECYTREHSNMTVERAREHVSQLISDAWKKLNRECLSRPSPFSSIFTKACLNVARMIPLMYSYDDSPSQESLKELMRSLAAHLEGQQPH
ncbi:(3S,6E)-nerolidol synthase [Salix suchowensis]|nr:(3S,6E)-nerolidol synthase [Salix suchowensis]